MKHEGKFSGFNQLERFASGKQYEDDFEHLVRCCNHCLSVREPLIPLLRVIVSDYRVPGDVLCRHDIADPPEVCVSMLCDVTRKKLLSGLIDGWVCTCKGDELLVAGEPLDVSNLSHELAGGDLADARHGCEYLDFLGMYFLFMLMEGVRDSLLALLQRYELLRRILDHVTSVGYSDAVLCKISDLLYRYGGTTASALVHKGGKDILVNGTSDLRGTPEFGEESEHRVSKDIHCKNFRPGNDKVGLELGLGSGDVLCNLLSASCDSLDLFIHCRTLPPEQIVMESSIICNGECICAVSLGLPEAVRHDLFLYQERVHTSGHEAAVIEEVHERNVVEPCGLHDEQCVLRDVRIFEEPAKSLTGHLDGAFGKPVVSFCDDSIIELVLSDVYTNYYGHCITSMVRKDGSLNPISHIEGSLKLNQPIGIKRELGQTPVEACSLGFMSPSVPSIINLTSSLWGFNY